MNLSINVSRALELYEKSEYSVAVSDFLSPGEKIEVYNELIARIGNGISRCFFWGGSRGAERCTTVFLPEWYMLESVPVHRMPGDEARTDRFAEHPRTGRLLLYGRTLEDDGYCRFPDAPTERGVKHLNELVACMADGYEAAVCFVIQMAGMKSFSPNDATHPAFGDALRAAHAAGVQVLAVGCHVEPDSLEITHRIPVVL